MSLFRGVMDRLCPNRLIQRMLTKRLASDIFLSSQRRPIIHRLFSRGQPAKGLAEAQRSIQKSTEKFTKFEKAFRAIGFTAAIGFCAYIVLPNTTLINYIQPLFQHHTRGAPTRVPSKLKALVKEVMEEVIETSNEEVKANAFIGTPSEPFLWGSTQSQFVLMLPETTMFDSQKEFDLAHWQFGGSSQSSSAESATLTRSQLEAEAATAFKQSVLLTENAKKFLVARELERGKAGHFWLVGGLPLLNCFTGLLVYKKMVSYLGLRRSPPILLSTAVVGSLLFWTGLTVLEVDGLRKKGERLVDAAASARGADYAKGGIEYYTKAMSRNVALRSLMPNDRGKKLYNRKGERNQGLLRRKHVAWSERRTICEKALGQ